MHKIAPDVVIELIEDNHNALGNLIVCNDKGAVASRSLRHHFDTISRVLKVPVVEGSVMDNDLVGSLCIATNKGFMIAIDAEEPDYESFKNNLKVNGDIGSINFGGIFVKSGIVANSNGVFVGKMSTGPELGRVDESLGFV